MGNLIPGLRKQQTTEEILETIDKDISKLQRFRRQNQEWQQKVVLRLVVGSISFSIFAALVIYFVYLPDNWLDRILYICLPCIGYVFFILGVRKVLHWFFIKRIANNDIALGELRERRKQMLEDVMENETYKKAKTILERFDPARFKQLEKPAATPSPQPQRGTPTLRQRMVPGARGTPSPVPIPGAPRMWSPASTSTPRLPRQGGPYTPRMAPPSQNGSFMQGYGPPPGPPLPRPVLPRERSTMDKMMEFLVGDGPANRYALICRHCHSHNGMALKEEFEYLSFRCCYCFALNPARKRRPYAPKLEFPVPASLQQSPQQAPQQAPQSQTPRPGASGPVARTTTEDGDSDEDEDDEEEEYDEEEEEGEENEEVNAALSKEKGDKPRGTTGEGPASQGGVSGKPGERKLEASTKQSVAQTATKVTPARPRPDELTSGLPRKQDAARQPEPGPAAVKNVPQRSEPSAQLTQRVASVQSREAPVSMEGESKEPKISPTPELPQLEAEKK